MKLRRLLCLALVLVAVIGCERNASNDVRSAANAPLGLLDHLDQTGVISAAYGVYPPYTMEDPNTHRVTGFSIDLLNEIASQLHTKVVWHRMNWDTMAADLKRGDFDVIADPIFETIPRARELSFTIPYSYFADGIVVVRSADRRFATLDDLNRTGLTIAVGQGWASEEIARARLPRPAILAVETPTNLLQVFDNVVSGRADAAVVDALDAQRYLRLHPGQLKAIGLEDPPAWVPAGFALRSNDLRGTAFLNSCLRTLKAMGVITALESKYNIRDTAPSGSNEGSAYGDH